MYDRGIGKFNFIVPDFLGVQFTSAPRWEGKKQKTKTKTKNWLRNQSVDRIEKQLETMFFCSLFPIYDLRLSFLMNFHRKFF